MTRMDGQKLPHLELLREPKRRLYARRVSNIQLASVLLMIVIVRQYPMIVTMLAMMFSSLFPHLHPSHV